MYLIDTHTHFDGFIEKGIEEQIIKRALNMNVFKMIVMSTDIAISRQTLLLSRRYSEIIPAVGIYPSEVEKNSVKDLEEIIKKNRDKIKAIGEIGIDLYYKDAPDFFIQKKVFEEQIKLAIKYNLPISVHIRNSIKETLPIIKKYKGKVKGVIHCFSEPEYIDEIFELGFLIGVNGLITYKSAANIKAMAKVAPLDKIVLETDAPYLAPRPYKSHENEPALLAKTAKFLADLKEISVEKLIKETTKNAEVLFNL